MSKLKIVWICHLSSIEINDLLKPKKRVNEMAPWIIDSIKLFENNEKYSLHIISPFEYINGVKKIEIRGVKYTFFNAHIPFWGRHWPRFFRLDYWTNFYLSKQKVKRIVNQIKPDIIHLRTAENAYISSTILPLIGKYPIITSVQGFISQMQGGKTYLVKKRIDCEKEILTKIKMGFYVNDKMKSDILNINPHMKLFWTTYPQDDILDEVSLRRQEKYDIVFFARLSKYKGIYDLIDAVSNLKKQGKIYSLCIIGSGNKEKILDYIKEKSIQDQVVFKGFLPNQKEVYTEAFNSKISVLPTYFDVIPGTIIQSMLLKIPVVAYEVGGIPTINTNEEVVKLVKKGNISQLAFEIDKLLTNDNLRLKLSNKSRQRALEMFCIPDEEIRKTLISGYLEEIKRFNSINKFNYIV